MNRYDLNIPIVSDLENLCSIYDLTRSESRINLRRDFLEVQKAERLVKAGQRKKRAKLSKYLGNFDDVVD